MNVSRTESQQLEKQRRSRRMRRLLVLNVTMFVIIVALAAMYLLNESDNRPREAAGETQGQTAAGPAGTGDAGGDGLTGSGSEVSAANDADKADASSSEPAGGTAPEAADDGSGDAGAGNPADHAGTIRLAFVGDILLASSVEDIMLKNGYDFPYAKALPFLSAADLTAGNLETPVTERGTPALNKQYVFKSSPKSLPALKEAGFDIVNLANNHTLDQGVEGLLDTIGHLNEAGIPNVGAGNDDSEAFKPVYLQANGITVAYVGLSRVVPEGAWKADKNRAGIAETYDSTRAIAAIKSAKEQSDIVVVMVHWGVERDDYPQVYQKSLAREFINSGADLIIGSHPHVLQGFETYKGKWIAYSLGNFIFNMTKTEKTKDTGVLDAVCSKAGGCTLQFHPMRVAQSQPAPLEGDEAKSLLARLSGLSFGVTVDSEGYVKAKE